MADNLPRQVTLTRPEDRLVWMWAAGPHGGCAGLHGLWSRVKTRRSWRADRRTMHMESQRPEQLLASHPGLCLKKKRLKVDWGGCAEGRVGFSVDFTWEDSWNDGAGGKHKSSRCPEELPGWCPVCYQHESTRPVTLLGNTLDEMSVLFQATCCDASGHKMTSCWT